MTEKRPIPFNHLFSIFKTKYPISFLGLIFTTLSLFVCIPIITIINMSKGAHEKYDYNKIIKQGRDLTAKVTLLEIENNVTVDNVFHPLIIAYTYNDHGQSINDKFKTLTNGNSPLFEIGDFITIKVYNGESVIKDLKPFTFPIHLFYISVLSFLLVGIPLLLIGLLPVIKHYKLYKSGIRSEATIISLTTTSIVPFISIRPNVLVNYFYFGQNGNKIFGSSISPGLYLKTEKKEQDKIAIFVSPTNEAISCIVPNSLL